MAFKLLEIDKFITSSGAKLVQRAQSFDRNFEPYPDGLQSKTIFGATRKEGFTNYGYIDLKTVIIHPLIYDNLSKINTVFNKILGSKDKFIIKEGMLFKSEAGGTGLGWLIENWSKIRFGKYRTEKNKIFIDFINNSQKGIIIVDKIPVIPIAYREADQSSHKIKDSDIDAFYKKILNLTGAGTDFESAFAVIQQKSKKDNIQLYVNQLYKFFIQKLEAKSGFFRNALAGRRLDSVARMVANARPDIPIDCVAIPWHILLNLFDIFIVSFLQLEENIKYLEKLGLEDAQLEEYGDIFDYIYRNVDTYVKYYPDKESLWIELLIAIFNKNPMLRVLLKRDPGWNADSFHCLKPIIRTGVSYEIIINSIYYSPLGGDSFNSNFLINSSPGNIISEDDSFIITCDNKKTNVIQTMETIYKKVT